MHVAATTTQHLLLTSQFLASLGGCQLKLHSPKCECELALVAIQVCKYGCGKVSSEQTLSHTNGFTSGRRH